jgi:hypothetical protein
MTRKSAELETVADVIDAFGGLKAMCKIFGGGPSKFCNWKATGEFPEKMHMRIYREARKRGLNVADHLIGGEQEEPQRELSFRAGDRIEMCHGR